MGPPVSYNASDRKQIRSKEKEAALALANRLAYVRRIMSDAPGRKWMHDLLEKCHVFHTPFVAGAPDVTSFRCGEANLGLQIFGDVVEAAPTEYGIMMQEASIKEAANDRRYSDDRSASAEYSGSSDDRRDAEGSEPGDYDPYADAST